MFLILRNTASIVRAVGRAQLSLRRLAHGLRAAVLGRLTFIAIVAISSEISAAQVELPQPDSRYPISVEAEHGNHWTEGAYDVWVLSGNCRLAQGPSHASANEAVLWIDHSTAVGEPGYKVITYLDGKVQLDFVVSPGSETDPKIQSDLAKGTISRSPAGPVAKLQDKTWFGRLYSNSAPEIHAVKSDPEPGSKPAVYVKATAAAPTSLTQSCRHSSKRPLANRQSCRPIRSWQEGAAAFGLVRAAACHITRSRHPIRPPMKP